MRVLGFASLDLHPLSFITLSNSRHFCLAFAQTALLKVNVIKAIDLIGKALHASRLPEGKKVRV